MRKFLGKTLSLCSEFNGDYNDYVFLRFMSLFNGKNLNGWHSFLKGTGVNTDPDSNFIIENNMLPVKGKDLGYVITDKGFNNYHFKVDFKWGDKKWPPREKEKRDAGVCYNIPVNEPDSIWPTSIECQVQEGDVGDFVVIGLLNDYSRRETKPAV